MPLGFSSLVNHVPTPQAWLWPDRLPLGSLALIDGDPGTNKSSLTYEFIARLTSGRAFYGSPATLPAGDALLFQAEDTPDVMKKNLAAAGADLGRVHVCDVEDPVSAFSTQESLGVIERTVVETRAKLVVVDPVTVYFGGAIQNEASVRRITTPLAAVARRTGCAIVLVRHLRKGGGTALQRGFGSIGLAAAVRSAFLVGVDPADREKRCLLHYKSSLGPVAKSLSFRPKSRENGLVLEWLGEVAYTASDFGGVNEESASALGEAKRVLYGLLAEGPVLVSEVQKCATLAGVSARTLRRAKERLSVRSERQGFGRNSKYYWVLPDNEAVRAVLDEEVADLTNKLVHGSPLDEMTPPMPGNVMPPGPRASGTDLLDEGDDDDDDPADWRKST